MARNAVPEPTLVLAAESRPHNSVVEVRAKRSPTRTGPVLLPSPQPLHAGVERGEVREGSAGSAASFADAVHGLLALPS